MTVQEEYVIRRYIGLSTDVKPVSSDVLVGSTFWESDTGFSYSWTGTEWAMHATPTLSTISNGVPSTFSKITENAVKFSVAKGQLNKFNLYPRINNEHCESSRKVQGVVSAANIVGQIFKASKDNITAISLTMESAAAIALDNFESYADSAALQAVWVESGNAATLETTIVKGGTKAMALPLDTAGDEWVNTIVSADFTDYTGSFDFYMDNALGTVEVFIGDGTNTKTFIFPAHTPNEWVHLEIDENAMVEDQAGITDTTAIIEIGYRVTSKRIGATCYIDNLEATPSPGSVEVKLWNMGATLPVSTTNSIDDGTQYTKINGDASSVILQLRGGKRLYHLHSSFTAGTSKNIPTNELLIPGNYYIIELKYVDTNVSVYGPDTSFATDYYVNGYAFTAPDEATAITAIGTYSDIMFTIQSMQDIYILHIDWKFDAAPNGSSDLFVFLEDTNMSITDVITDHEEKPDQTESEDVSIRPMFMEDGGKCEFYYNDDFTDSVSTMTCKMTYLFEPPTVNG